MIVEIIDQITEGFVSRYMQDTRVAEAALLRQMDSVTFASSKNLGQLERDIWELQNFNAKEVSRYLSSAANRLVGLANGDQAANPVFSEVVEENLTSIVFSVLSQRVKDNLQIVKYQRETAMRLGFVSNFKTDLKSAVALANSVKQGQLKLVALDRAGRRWDSEKYIKTSVRLFLLTTYNEAKLIRALKTGRTTAFVSYKDPTSANHNLEFEIIGASENSYHAIRERIFHPNSQAVVSESKSPVTRLLSA